MCRIACALLALVAAGPARAEGPAPGKGAKRLTLGDATLLVRIAIFTENPRMNPKAEFPLTELTTDPVWERLGAQVFQVTEGVQHCETFVVKDRQVYRIGRGFGGFGVTSLAVADLNRDGQPKLVYAFSWGSGEHRSQVGVFDCLAKEPRETIAGQSYFANDDLAVARADDRTVVVKAGGKTVGRVVLEGKEGQRKAKIRLDEDVPADVKKRFVGKD